MEGWYLVFCIFMVECGMKEIKSKSGSGSQGEPIDTDSDAEFKEPNKPNKANKLGL